MEDKTYPDTTNEEIGKKFMRALMLHPNRGLRSYLLSNYYI